MDIYSASNLDIVVYKAHVIKRDFHGWWYGRCIWWILYISWMVLSKFVYISHSNMPINTHLCNSFVTHNFILFFFLLFLIPHTTFSPIFVLLHPYNEDVSYSLRLGIACERVASQGLPVDAISTEHYVR